MEKGINVLTSGYNVMIDGADELIKEWEDGKINKEELLERLMDLETVLVDLTKTNVDEVTTKFKDTKE